MDEVRAKQEAHYALDCLWRGDLEGSLKGHALISRTRAYDLLAKELGSEEQVHMRCASLETAMAVPAAVAKIRARLESRTKAQVERDWRRRGKEIARSPHRLS